MIARTESGDLSDGGEMKHLYVVAREDNAGLRFEAPRCYRTEEEAVERFDELVLQAKGERYFVFALAAGCVASSTGRAKEDVAAIRARYEAADAAATGKR